MSVQDGDDPDHNIGDFVYARPMSKAYFGADAWPVLLYVNDQWIEGVWDVTAWITADGNIRDRNVPKAWAPLPKTPEDWV